MVSKVEGCQNTDLLFHLNTGIGNGTAMMDTTLLFVGSTLEFKGKPLTNSAEMHFRFICSHLP